MEDNLTNGLNILNITLTYIMVNGSSWVQSESHGEPGQHEGHPPVRRDDIDVRIARDRRDVAAAAKDQHPETQQCRHLSGRTPHIVICTCLDYRIRVHHSVMNMCIQSFAVCTS